MAGLDCCTGWAAKIQPILPAETRAGSINERRDAQKKGADRAAA